MYMRVCLDCSNESTDLRGKYIRHVIKLHRWLAECALNSGDNNYRGPIYQSNRPKQINTEERFKHATKI